MSSTYIYAMHRVNKFHGPDKQVLSEISLSFLPGAKIGVLGPNGAGKSTLLRIMAGLDEPSNGRSEEHTSELQSLTNLVCRLLLEKKKKNTPAVTDIDRNCDQ